MWKAEVGLPRASWSKTEVIEIQKSFKENCFDNPGKRAIAAVAFKPPHVVITCGNQFQLFSLSRSLCLRVIPFLELQILFAIDLRVVTLRLGRTPSFGYISPEDVATCPSVLTKLDEVSLGL